MDDFDDQGDTPRYPHRGRDVAWVDQARSGDDRAFGRLYDAWFDRVFDLTFRIVRNHDIALEVTQDSFLSAWRSLGSLTDTGSFGGWLLRIARNAALNRHQRERRSTPVDDQDLAVMEAAGTPAGNAPVGFTLEDRLAASTDPERALERAEARELVWQAAEVLGERDTAVLDLQLRHGLSPAEIGEVLGLNRNAANQLLHRVRGRFEVALRARLLWRNDKPACKELRRLLASAGVDGFTVEAVKIADKHAPSCPECADRRRSALSPAAMFAAIPTMAVPIAFKQQAAAALEGAGVPMSGSAFAGAGALPEVAATAGSEVNGAGGAGTGGSATTTGGAAGAARASRHARSALVAIGAGVVIVIGMLVVATERLSETPSNEVVATASGAAPPSPVPAGTGEGRGVATDPNLPSGISVVPFDPGTPGTGAPPPGSGVVSSPTSSTGPTRAQRPSLPSAPPVPPDSSIPDPSSSQSLPLLPVTAEISVSPTDPGGRFPIGKPVPGKTPFVTWRVSGTGITAIHVSGPGLASSTATFGSVPVCPTGQVRGGDCVTTATARIPYTYVLEVSGPGGTVLARKTAMITM